MKKMTAILCAMFVVVALTACRKSQPRLPYPATKKVDQVDDYFGTKVADPYRWLEDDNAPDVKAWVQAENAVTFGYLDKIPFRPKIKARLTEIYNYPRYSSPFRAGEYYFFYKNDGLQNQSVCYIQKGLDGTPEVFFDPNALSPDGTVRLGIVSLSKDDRYVAVSRGEAGSDWSELRVMEVATKKELPDRVRWVKFSGAAWQGDGFYYSGYDKPAPGQELKAKNEFQKVFFHKLGDPQEKDALVWEDKAHPLRYVGAETTEDEKTLFLVVSEGTSGNELYVKDLTKKGAKFGLLVKGFEFDSAPIDTVAGGVLVHTNVDAPNFRVVLIDPARAGQGELAGRHPGETRGPERSQHRRRLPLLQLPQGRQHQDLSARPRRQARPRDRAARPRHGRRLRRQDATRRRSSTPSPRSPTRRRSTSTTRPRASRRSSARARSSSTRPTTRPSRSSTPARTARRSRCSSSTRRGSRSTAGTRPTSRPTAASISA